MSFRFVLRTCRFSLAAVAALALASCGYIHFGRLPPRSGDVELQHAFSDLALQHKILKQELELARKEADALRTALDRSGTGSASAPELARQLEETARDLAALRVNYARLEAEKGASASSDVTAKFRASALQEENQKLQRELAAARAENATLASQLKSSMGETEQVRTEVSQLNLDLAQQKQARERAELAASALRAQLEAVMARAGRADESAPPVATTAPMPAMVTATSTPALAPENPLTALQRAKAPPSEAVPHVEIRTSVGRGRMAAPPVLPPPLAASSPSTELPPNASAPAAAISPVAPVAAPGVSTSPAPEPVAPHPPRTYTVKAGDTLEKIAVRVYGAADQWTKIYTANSELLSTTQGLKQGMELQIP